MIRLLFFLPLLLAINASAQSVIKGTVHDVKDRQPLAGVTVFWLHNMQSVSTDANGNFTLPVDSNAVQLVFSFSGYTNDTIRYRGQSTVLIYLRKTVELVEVVVEDKQNSISINPLGIQKTEVMTQKELRKAACCNLSESFETSTSVDVAYADAITGVKQIQLLGLEGKYTLMTIENQPRMRGLATNFGLNYIPGTWVESIQLSKGTGTVVNGYESIGGQINVELQKPHKSERLYFNQYINSMGRNETNLNLAHKINSKWSTNLLLHADLFDGKVDMNNDQFLDIPVNNQLGLMNAWKYMGTKGLESEFGVKLLNENRYGGETSFDHVHEKGTTRDYGVVLTTKRYEAFGKIGYVWDTKSYKSLGFTSTYTYLDQNNYFGTKHYTGLEESFYSNLIYNYTTVNNKHGFKTGASLLIDDYRERYDSLTFNRAEMVPGVFGEYTWSPSTRFSWIAGLRYDMHNLFGNFFTPRTHLRYAVNSHLTLRASAGRGLRVANIFAENTALFVSSRNLFILPSTNKGFGLQPEVAWNYGLNVMYDFKLFYRKGSISMDYYRTDFENQVIADRDFSTNALLIYNRQNAAYVNSWQLEFNYELVKRLDFKTAYRFLDMQTRYLSGTMQQPFVARNRYFVNMEYTTKKKWSFDYTLQWFGPKRIPQTAGNPIEDQMGNYSPAYTTMNAQISKQWKKLNAYIGVENLTNYRQKDLILGAQQPFAKGFDASMVWGPVIGRMVYAGIRYKIK
jgi:outer membrane receptor for ferrienterochelin and colicins